MEKRDERLIAELVMDNVILKQHIEQHQEYEKQLEDFNKQLYLSSRESLERKRIQKLKLANRDRIELILAEHRRDQNRPENQESLSA
ncbi:MAG: DUF465 domain-containing protein [Deltaproteobacteria bacterium]|nr:DUF465 domain-containing protein [Deltaproteobacteria bacterium]